MRRASEECGRPGIVKNEVIDAEDRARRMHRRRGSRVRTGIDAKGKTGMVDRPQMGSSRDRPDLPHTRVDHSLNSGRICADVPARSGDRPRAGAEVRAWVLAVWAGGWSLSAVSSASWRC
jgi:hypothetical protein